MSQIMSTYRACEVPGEGAVEEDHVLEHVIEVLGVRATHLQQQQTPESVR